MLIVHVLDLVLPTIIIEQMTCHTASSHSSPGKSCRLNIQQQKMNADSQKDSRYWSCEIILGKGISTANAKSTRKIHATSTGGIPTTAEHFLDAREKEQTTDKNTRSCGDQTLEGEDTQ